MDTILLVLYDIYWQIRIGKVGKETVRLGNLQIESKNRENGEAYQAVSYFLFRKAAKNLPVDIRTSTAIDFGSGKGHMVLMAAWAGFARVLGVEFCKELHAQSLGLLERKLSHDRMGAVEVLLADAADYEIPDAANVFFFFNPFNAVVFSGVLKNIDMSMSRNSRDVYIVYFNPKCAALLLEHGYEVIYEHCDRVKPDILILRKIPDT